jgi:hypothetical protein
VDGFQLRPFSLFNRFTALRNVEGLRSRRPLCKERENHTCAPTKSVTHPGTLFLAQNTRYPARHVNWKHDYFAQLAATLLTPDSHLDRAEPCQPGNALDQWGTVAHSGAFRTRTIGSTLR